MLDYRIQGFTTAALSDETKKMERQKVTVYFKHLTLLQFRVAKFRTKRSFYRSMERGILLQRAVHSPDFMSEFRLLS